MKTHAVKGNRILKSVDFVLIVLTMSFVTFMFIKATLFLPDLTNCSETSASQKVEFPVLQLNENAVMNEKTAQETTVIPGDRSENAVIEEKSEKAEIKSVSVKSNTVTAIKGSIPLEAAKIDQSLTATSKSKIDATASVTDANFDKSILSQWIKDRDDWEQK